MQGLIRTIAALALMALASQPALAQQSEAQSILSSIVAKTRDIGNVCTSRRPTYFCGFLESASLRAGKLRVRREIAWINGATGKHHVEYDEGEVDLQSVYPTIKLLESGPHFLNLACKAGDCVDERTHDGKQVRRGYIPIVGSYETNTKPAEEILRLFERLIALCSEASC